MENVNTLSQASSGFARSTGDTSDTTDVEGDFETFLTLLTAQLRNQDPLKPVESTAFVAQLASFSAVEQQVKSNENLESILEALANGATGGLAQWIGKEVRNAGTAPYENVPLDVQTFVHRDADAARLVVYNENGTIVATQSIDPAEENANWSGILDNGQRAQSGEQFSFKVESLSSGEVILETSGFVFSKVDEVRLIQGQTVLQFADGSKMFADEVTSMREAE
ncbi:MAG: flagellin biosynthesis protein FlgD [Rhodobacteraceae bacterium]|nr:flagellin biosynthesis protein FlgD [Paracoccaceae bacterium]